MLVEIGPGTSRISSEWVTVDCENRCDVDYVCQWGQERLPFADSTVDIVYASHVLEHIPWTHTEQAIQDVRRILKVGGLFEIWVPDFRYLVECYLKGICGDDWRVENLNDDPMVWLNGRIFTYGGDKGLADPNWHRAVFDRDSLTKLLINNGFHHVGLLFKPRGHDHGKINLGVGGYKV